MISKKVPIIDSNFTIEAKKNGLYNVHMNPFSKKLLKIGDNKCWEN